MDRHGAEKAVETFVVIIIMLAVLGLTIYFLRDGVFGKGQQVMGIATCYTFGDTFTQGRCFSTENCDAKEGWVEAAKLGCPKTRPYCCYLEDPDLYYPENTLLLEVYGETDATFRLSESSQAAPQLEYGDDGAERFLREGIPKNAAYVFRYKVSESTMTGTLYCKIDVGTYQFKNGVDQARVATCTMGEFTPLNEPITYQVIRRGKDGKTTSCAPGNTEFCAIEVVVTTGAAPTSVNVQPKRFYIPFQK